jgi:hypothetical protein
MRMFRLSLFVFCAAVLSAQDPAELFHQPPPDVDRALRERVTEFFELHVKGEFRQAESLVAEDTKDFFYNGNKPRYISFEITHIKYNEDFTKAQVTLMCEQYIHAPGFEGKPMKVPTPSTWKLENGKWCWYVDQEQLHNTPFGRMWSDPKASSSGPAPAPPLSIATTAQQFYALFKVDKDSVALAPGGTGQVTISNGSPGSMTVEVIGALEGVEAKLDRAQVKAGDKAVLTLHAAEGAKSGTLKLRIAPIGKIVPIAVSVK